MSISKKMNTQLNQARKKEGEEEEEEREREGKGEKRGRKERAGHGEKEADEERTHALKILGYIQEVGGTVTLEALSKPRASYPSVEAAVKTASSQEKKVTGQINALVALAEQEKDYATRSFLNWFVDEQVEEEASMSALLQLVEMAGKNVLQLESHLARMGHSG